MRRDHETPEFESHYSNRARIRQHRDNTERQISGRCRPADIEILVSVSNVYVQTAQNVQTE